MHPVPLTQLPEDLRLRVLAATGDPTYLLIHQRSDAPDAAPKQYLVEAITGDRVTIMRLSTRPDGSVSEATDSFITREVLAVTLDEGRAELVVNQDGGRRKNVPVTPQMADRVRASRINDCSL